MLHLVFNSLKGNAAHVQVLHSGLTLLCGFRVSDFCAVGVLAPPDGVIKEDALTAADVVVFGYPTHLFGEQEREVLWDYVQRGGSILVLSGDGGDRAAGTTTSCKLNLQDLKCIY
jgi:hypothetical protein